MARTTIDIDTPILLDLKRLQKEEKKSLGQLISELVAQALAQRKAKPQKSPPFKWPVYDLGLKVDLTDKDALWAILDEDLIRKHRG